MSALWIYLLCLFLLKHAFLCLVFSRFTRALAFRISCWLKCLSLCLTQAKSQVPRLIWMLSSSVAMLKLFTNMTAWEVVGYQYVYLYVPLHTYIYLYTVPTSLLMCANHGAKPRRRLNYTPRNGLIQVVDFPGLMQVCRRVALSWIKSVKLISARLLQDLLKQVASSL